MHPFSSLETREHQRQLAAKRQDLMRAISAFSAEDRQQEFEAALKEIADRERRDELRTKFSDLAVEDMERLIASI